MTARSFEVFRIELSSVISDFKKGVPLTGQALTNVRAAAQRPERNAKISAAQKGRVFPGDRIKLSASVSATMTPEHRVHLAEKARQRPPISNETRAKMSKSHMGQTHPNFSHPGEKNPFFGKTHSQETKAKLSASSKGRPSAWKGAIVSDEIRAKISAGKRGRTPKKVIVTCPHCGKEGASTIMPRYHFNKCKLKPVML